MLKTLKSFFVHQLFILHTGLWYSKLKASFVLGASLSPFAIILERLTNWYIDQQVTVLFFCGAILVDWACGGIKHCMQKTFDWKLNGLGLLIKISMMIAGSFLAEALPHFLGENVMSNSLIIVMRLSIFMYPAGSAWMNMAVITNGVFPPVGWIKRIKSFNENLNLNNLKDGEN